MSGFCWPFRSKSPSQYRRIDQGWDLQVDHDQDVLAIADGTLFYGHDPGSNGAHFGDPYPVLRLATPLPKAGGIYYGHTIPMVRPGSHVVQGDVIAVTSTPGGGGAPAHWLEIGAWINGPTGDGQWMHDALINAPVFVPASPPSNGMVVRMDYVVTCTTPGTDRLAQFLWRCDGVILPLGAAVDADNARNAGARVLPLDPASYDKVAARAI